MPGLPGTQTARGLNAAGIVGIHSLLDEGGYGDNVHDDAAVLTAIFNAAPSTGICVILPIATYNFGSAPSVPANSALIIPAGVVINNNQPTAAAGGLILDWRNQPLAGSNVVRGGIEADLFGQSDTIAAGDTVTLDAGYQAVAYGTHTVNGTLTVNGTFRVVAW